MNGPSVARLPQDHPARSPPAKCRRMARMIAAFSSGVVYGAKREAEAIESSTACTATVAASDTIKTIGRSNAERRLRAAARHSSVTSERDNITTSSPACRGGLRASRSRILLVATR